MKINDFCQNFSKSGEFREKSRLLVIPNHDEFVQVRDFLNHQPEIQIVRVSDCIARNDFVVPPAKLFLDLQKNIAAWNDQEKVALVIGLDAVFALWNDEHIDAAMRCLRALLDEPSLRFLAYTQHLSTTAASILGHPKYREGQALLHLGSHAESNDIYHRILFVDKEFSAFPLPGYSRNGIQQVVQELEDGSLPEGSISVFVNYNGTQWAGIHANIPQIFSIPRFLEFFCDYKGNLSPEAVAWLYQKMQQSKTIASLLQFAQQIFFPEGVSQEALTLESPQKIRNASGAEREALLWMLKQSVLPGSYLFSVLNNPNFEEKFFTQFYVCEALNHLTDAEVAEWVAERQKALLKIGTDLISGELATFIKYSREHAIEKIAPWLNLQTSMEYHELLRRYMESDLTEVPSKILASYPLLAAYCTPYQLGYHELNQYFTQYRNQKIKNKVSEDFCKIAQKVNLSISGIASRDVILQKHVHERDTALLVVDALGVEYLPLILDLARKRDLGVTTAEVAYAKLPTSTAFNLIQWPTERRLQDIKALDSIIHNGAEIHLSKPVEENFAAQLEIFEAKIMPEIAQAITRFSQVILTSDHGATRLATCAYQQGLSQTIPMAETCTVDDWRYMKTPQGQSLPQELVENLSGTHWVVKGYNRLPQKGGRLYEMHGGASYEECLVPVVIFKQGAVFVPQAQQPLQTPMTNAEFIEDDDFNLL